MKKTVISVTEAARNFADCVNRVHYQDVTFVLHKNGIPVARLVPDHEKACTGEQLAAILRGNPLSPDDAQTWRRDLRGARKALKAPIDTWR